MKGSLILWALSSFVRARNEIDEGGKKYNDTFISTKKDEGVSKNPLYRI